MEVGHCGGLAFRAPASKLHAHSPSSVKHLTPAWDSLVSCMPPSCWLSSLFFTEKQFRIVSGARVQHGVDLAQLTTRQPPFQCIRET